MRARGKNEGIANRIARIVLFFSFPSFYRPHYHPRGTENFFVLSGKVRANFLREAPEQKVVANDVSAGFAGFFPEAHVHFLQNLGCEPAETLSFFDTSDEGLVDIASTLQFPKDTIQLSLGNNRLEPSDDLLDDVLIQSRKCLRRCKKLGKVRN